MQIAIRTSDLRDRVAERTVAPHDGGDVVAEPVPDRAVLVRERVFGRWARRPLAAERGAHFVEETSESIALTMHFPTRWDPYFRPAMSVLDVYHYGTEHYEHHRRQLTL